jgi:hypothetical protein
MGLFRPREPVWFLGVIGVDPARQGQGLGRAVITPGLQTADADDVPTFLETQDPANVPFYESLGFDVVAELDLPDNGPKHWAMRRPRAPPASDADCRTAGTTTSGPAGSGAQISGATPSGWISIGWFNGLPPGPGVLEMRSAISSARCSEATSTTQ